MIREVNEAKAYLIDKFGSVEKVKSGTYAIPVETTKGSAFMKVVINENMAMSDFKLFKDKALKISWYE